MTIDGPADDPSAEGIQYDGAVQLSLPRRVLGDVGDPELIGAISLNCLRTRSAEVGV
jgi:hypothetical protein